MTENKAIKFALLKTLAEINMLIQYQEERLLEYGDNKYSILDSSGRPIFTELFITKAHIMVALVNLKESRMKIFTKSTQVLLVGVTVGYALGATYGWSLAQAKK